MTDRTSIVTTADDADATGGKLVVSGTRVAGTKTVSGSTVSTGGRIVIASEGVTPGEGVTEATKLASADDYATVPLGQLVAAEDGTATAGLTAAYDWLTVDKVEVQIDEYYDENGKLHKVFDDYSFTVPGGNVGAVHPTRQSIRGILWNDKNNNGIQDATTDENGVRTVEEPMNGYEVTLERYYFNYNDAAKGWQKDASFAPRTTTTDRVMIEQATGKTALDLAVGEDLVAVSGNRNDLYRSGTYSFDDLETSGLVGTDWVVYGYKVRVSDPRVTENELFKAKYQVTGAGYRENSDLAGDNNLVEPDEYIVLLQTVADDGTTPDGLTSHESNIIYAPASNNDDQTPNLVLDENGNPELDGDGNVQVKDPLTTTAGGQTLVAYDLMLGASRDHNDGGLIEPPAYAIDGYVWEDADYDGLYNYNTEERTTLTKDGTKVTEDFIEYGYNNKQVILKQWLYENGQWVQNENFGDDENVKAANIGEPTVKTLNPDAATINGLTPGARLTYTIPNSTYLGAGEVAVLTGDNPNLVAKDKEGNELTVQKDGAEVPAYVSGYYLFDQLPTAVRQWNPTTKTYDYTLVSYTVEVNGKKSDEGMASLLVTTHEAQTTAHDVVNSRVQPMVTEAEQNPATNKDGLVDLWKMYDADNYPVFLSQSEIQTGAEVHHGDACGVKDYPCTTVEGEISKNNAAWRIILAGKADDVGQPTFALRSGQTAAYHVDGLTAEGDAKVPMVYDFAIGQNQNAMNAGFVPPDRSSLVGQAWFDENYDGKNDADTSDDRIDTDDRDKTEQGVGGLRVVLTQYYFVPDRDEYGHQMLEDEDGNVFYLGTTAHGENNQYPNGELRLVENRGKNVVEGDGGKVYLVRSGRTYDYDALYAAGIRTMVDSGYWVENTNLNGGFQYREGVSPEPPAEEEENPTQPSTPETGEEEAVVSRVVTQPAVSAATLMALAADEGAGVGAGEGTETGGDSTETGGDNTQVTVPGSDPGCTHDKVTVAGHKNGTHDWICDACGEQHLNESCFDGNAADGVAADGKCDVCGDCLHLNNLTYAAKDGDVHTVTCTDCNEVLGEKPHVDVNHDGVCDGCGADMCKHNGTPRHYEANGSTHNVVCDVCGKVISSEAHDASGYDDNKNNTHKVKCDKCQSVAVEAADHVDADHDSKCDQCGGFVIAKHQLWTRTDAEGVYDFDNLPGYVLVGSDVDVPAKPEDKITSVYQPYGVANAQGTALSTSDLKLLHARAVDEKMIASLNAEEIKSLSAEQMATIVDPANAALKAAYDKRQEELKAADPTFETATPYLTGYSIKVVDDTGQYVASRFHVDRVGEKDVNIGDNSDLAAFDSQLTDNVNDNGKSTEVYAVVAEEIDKDADLNAGILSSAYAVTYRQNNYDLANRMYYKRAFDAGLTKRMPVLIDGNVWNDADSDGIMQEGEERIPGAVVRLQRYWYDETGAGYWEPALGEGGWANSGLSEEEYKAIENMPEPWSEKDEEITEEERAALEEAARGMLDFIGGIKTELEAFPEGRTEEKTAAYRKALWKLNVLEAKHGGAMRSALNDAGEHEIYNAFEECISLIDEYTPASERGVWRRDWTFSQDDAVELTGTHDLTRDGLGWHTYEPLSADEALNLASEDEKATRWVSETVPDFPYVPGSAFDVTDENGYWDFMAYGTGDYKAFGEPFKVLFSYKAEVVSYPDADVWAPTLQHVDDTVNDWVNSDFDDDTQGLRPNVKDQLHAGDFVLPSLLEEAGKKAGDLIILSRPATSTESSHTSGAYVNYGDVPEEPEEPVEPIDPIDPIDPTDPCEHEDLLTKGDDGAMTDGADGFCDKCGDCLHEKDSETGLCTDFDCDHAGPCCKGEPTPGADVNVKPGEEETFSTQVFAAAAAATSAAAFAADATTGAGANTKPTYPASFIKEVTDWLDTATMDDLENMSDEYRLAIFGNQKRNAAGELLYLDENDAEKTAAELGEGADLSRPVYDGTGDPELFDAYEARYAELTGDNLWSDLNWKSSLAHGYGLFRIAQAHIAGVVWQDDNYNGIQDAGENVRIPNVPVSLKRYWFGTDATGTGWHLDETFSQTTVSDGQGHWIFDNLDVAGKRMVGGKETTVLYGFEVTVDDLPRGYGVTHMNRGTATTDSDLNEDTKLIEPGDPQGGLIVLAQPSDRRDLVGNGAAYILGPNGTVWVISLSEDSDYNDTGLVPYALAAIAGVVFDDPEADGLQDDTAVAVPGQKVHLDRMVIDVDAVGFNGASYAPTALAAVEGQKVRSEDGWAEVASMETDVDGAYRFDGLPMVDGNDKPYLYRVRSYMPDGKEWVAINVGSDENNDSDWGEAANSVVGAGGRVGITPAMSVLGAFQTVRTTPNAYGQKFNLLVPYNWVPEDGRSVDLGMTGDADAWRTLVFTTPWGTRLFYVKLPQTGDELLPWMVGLALVAALGLVLAVAARRRDDDDEEEEETPEE